MDLSIESHDGSKSVKNVKADYIPIVLVVGSGLSGGGAEARLSRLVSHIFNGRVDLALLSGDAQVNELTAGQIFFLRWQSKWSYPRMLLELRNIIRKGQYDAVIAFGLFPIAITALALMGMAKKSKFVVSEITRPIAEAQSLNRMRKITYYYTQKLLYKRGDLITANSIDGLVETCQLISANHAFGVRLPNIVDIKQIGKKASQEAPCPVHFGRYLICVGRLEFMKRIDTVIDAFSLLRDCSNCGLVIVGDGAARQALEVQVRRLGLQNSVTFTGKLENPFPLLKNASAFILASEYEGFSNSAIEAMFCDVPVITSFCSSDAREMCSHGAALGFEVGDKFQLAEHMSVILNDKSIGQKLIGISQEYRARHELNKAIPIYENVIRRVLGHADV